MERHLGIELNIAGFCVSRRHQSQHPQAQHPQAEHMTIMILLQELIRQIGMETGGMRPDVRIFPVNGDKGGVGSTTFQPLTESFAFGMQPSGALFVDAWSEHGHDFIVLASCKPIDFRVVGQWFMDQGITIIDSFIEKLESRPRDFKLVDKSENLLKACN
jgi:hypothetical protein